MTDPNQLPRKGARYFHTKEEADKEVLWLQNHGWHVKMAGDHMHGFTVWFSNDVLHAFESTYVVKTKKGEN